MSNDPVELYRQARESAVSRNKQVLPRPGEAAPVVEGEATEEQIKEARQLFNEATAQATKRRGEPK